MKVARRRRQTLPVQPTEFCHFGCIKLTKFELINLFSTSSTQLKLVKPHEKTFIDLRIVTLLTRKGLVIDSISPQFRSQFQRAIKAAAIQIKRAELKSQPRKDKFCDAVKSQPVPICLQGENVSKIDVVLIDRNQELENEVRKMRSKLRCLDKTSLKVIKLKRLTVDQRYQLDRLKCSLAISNSIVKKYKRKLKFVKVNARRDYTKKTKRDFARRAMKQLKQCATDNSMKLISATVVPPCSDKAVHYNFSEPNPQVEKPVTPQFTTKIISESQLSMKAYVRIYRRLENILPTPYSVRAAQQELVKSIPATETRIDGKPVANVEYVDVLKERIRSLVTLGEVENTDSVLRIKISGDGTRLGHKVKLVTLCFVVIKPDSPCQSEYDVSNIVIARCNEDYSDASKLFGQALQQNTTEVVVDGTKFKLEYYFCSDYKFMLIVTGMKSATSKHPCLFCRKNKENFKRLVPRGYRRTIEDRGLEAEGVSANAPIISFIPLSNFILDILHLKLRICDQLFEFILDEITRMDQDDNLMPKKRRPLISNRDLFREYLLTKFDIKWEFSVTDKNTPKCSFRGTQYDCMLKKFCVKDACPRIEPPVSNQIQKVITLFDVILTMLRKLSISPQDIQHIKQLCTEWHSNSQSLLRKKQYTPYMHLMAEHISEMLHQHGSIYPFANEGVEAYNCLATRHFQTRTNHKEGSLKQMLDISTRSLVLSTKFVAPPLAKNRCSNCHEEGHKKQTCSKDPESENTMPDSLDDAI